MDTKLIILEACVGVCTILSVYIVIALTWFQCKPRIPAVEVEKPRRTEMPETVFRNGVNKNEHKNRPPLRNGQQMRHDVVQNQRSRRNTHHTEEDKQEKESEQKYDRPNKKDGEHQHPQHIQQQNRQGKDRQMHRRENGQQRDPRTEEQNGNPRRPTPNGRQPREDHQDREQNSLHFVRNGNSRRHPQDVPVTTNHAVALQRLCLCASWLVLLRYGIEHAILFLANNESTSWINCDILIRTHIVFYLVPLTVQYIFLWLKQRVLYLNPILRHNSWGCTACISWFVLLIFLLSEGGSLSLFMINEKYERNLTANATSNYTWAPCNPVQTGTMHDFIPWLVLGLLALLFQAMFFILFIQPLVCQAGAINVVEAAIQRHNTESIFSRIKRIFLASSISAITDLLTVVGAMVSGDLYISFVILDFNLLINQICVIFAYQSWRMRLCPFCCGEPPDEDNISVAFSRNNYNGGNHSRSPISSTSTALEEVFE